MEAPAPSDVQQLCSYFGMLNYHSCFIPDLSMILQPLNALLQSGIKWSWTEQCRTAFTLSKQLLLESKVLMHYDVSSPVTLACDVSAYGVGVVLSHHFKDGTERPISFVSWTLSNAERNIHR